MNRQTPPPFMPVPPLSGDSIQIQAFAMAGERNFLHLNSTLGISLETDQYRRLQQHFFKTEARNPTMGELRLLGHIYPRFPLARRAAPGEIYTNSTVIMDTWADAMEGFRALCNNPEQLCTLSELLSLPEAYLARTGRLNLPQKFRVSADEGGLEALSQGFRPIATVTPNGGAPRNLWVKAPESDTSFRDAAPKAGDILLAIPPTRWEALCAFLYEHPLASAIKAVTAVKNTSLLVAALSLCQGRGLTVNLNTLVSPSAHPEGSLIKQYLDTWEADAPAGTAYAVLLLPPAMQALLFTALSEHGFSPKLLGTVTKKPYLIFSDGATTPVHLKSDILLDTPRQSFRYVLSEPKPICGSLPQYMTLSRMITVLDTDCTVLDATLQVRGDEGFTPAVQGILSLCFAYAAAGITYDQVAISPVLYMAGTEKSPLLLSAVCGLYRAATELAIPLTAPEILFKPAAEGEPHTLVLSLTAYTSATPRECSDSLVAPELPLCLMSLDADPRWEDIRGLLFTTARAVLHNAQTTAHPLLGESVTSHLSRMAAINPTLQANLFDTHRELLSASLPFAMIAVGDILPGGLHIGNTDAVDEGKVPPSCEPPMLSPSITPYPTVILQEMKDKETKRRKELAAMEKLKNFESLSLKPRTVLLDTDIGPDCDDVGALAVLIYYAKQYGFPIGGICNCTSNKAGNGVIDAVCRRCGIETPPLGQWHGAGFMDSIEHCKYNTAVAEAHSEAYRNGTLPVDDEVTFYRKRLAEAKDGDVMVISIGMFNNLAALLESPADDISPLTGTELVKAKVYALVSMAAILPQGRECNVVSDYKSAEKVFANWPTAIYLSDFHIGVNVKTGYGHITDPEDIMADPLPMSYHLYTKDWNWEGAIKGQNASYDLTAVQFAALGVGDLYGLDTPGDLEFYAEIPDLPDATRFVENPMGNKIFMTKKVSDEAIAETLQKILESF